VGARAGGPMGRGACLFEHVYVGRQALHMLSVPPLPEREPSSPPLPCCAFRGALCGGAAVRRARLKSTAASWVQVSLLPALQMLSLQCCPNWPPCQFGQHVYLAQLHSAASVVRMHACTYAHRKKLAQAHTHQRSYTHARMSTL